MSKARLVITAVIVEGRSQAEVARAYGVSKGWVSKLVARYRVEADAAFQPRSRRPKTSPSAIAATTVNQIIEIRRELVTDGLNAGPDTIAWHLELRLHITVSVSTIARTLTRHPTSPCRSQRPPPPCPAPSSSPHNPRSDPSRPTSVSKPSNPTRPGKPTSLTTASPPAPTSRSSPGSTTTPATHCRSPHT